MKDLPISDRGVVGWRVDESFVGVFYHPIGVEMSGNSPEEIADNFLREYGGNFGIESLDGNLRMESTRPTGGLLSLRYQQQVRGVDVYGGLIGVCLRRDNNKVIAVSSCFDTKLSSNFSVDPSISSADELPLDVESSDIRLTLTSDLDVAPELLIYRSHHDADELDERASKVDRGLALWEAQLQGLLTARASKGQVNLVWRRQVSVQSDEWPSTVLEVMVNAHHGGSVAIHDLADYAAVGKGQIFMPDPVTMAHDESLRVKTDFVLPKHYKKYLREVELLGLDEPSGAAPYRLQGEYCFCTELGWPNYVVESSDARFYYHPDDPELWSVTAYYWIDRLQRHLQFLGVNAASFPVKVDPQGSIYNNSNFLAIGPDGPRIKLGLGYSPDAADPAIIGHEYGHAVHFDQGFPSHGFVSDLREGWSDIFARLFMDRFVGLASSFRAEVFTFEPIQYRRVDWILDYGKHFSTLHNKYHRGSVWASSIWRIFLSLGGDSADRAIREWAANLVLRLHLDANVAFSPVSLTVCQKNHLAMAQALLAASETLTDYVGVPGGLCHKVIQAVFVARRLLPAPPVDAFIDQGRRGTYSFREAHELQRSPSLVVRRAPGDLPSAGHQGPLVGQANYLWVRVEVWPVLGDVGEIRVRTFSANTDSEFLFPSQAHGIDEDIHPWSEEKAWYGPYEFTPSDTLPMTLMAVVDVEADSSVLLTRRKGSQVSSRLLVLMDNNIAQRVVEPIEP